MTFNGLFWNSEYVIEYKGKNKALEFVLEFLKKLEMPICCTMLLQTTLIDWLAIVYNPTKWSNIFKHFVYNLPTNCFSLTILWGGALPIHSQYTLSLPPENIRKPYGFLMFLGVRERVHWERMGQRVKGKDNADINSLQQRCIQSSLEHLRWNVLWK